MNTKNLFAAFTLVAAASVPAFARDEPSTGSSDEPETQSFASETESRVLETESRVLVAIKIPGLGEFERARVLRVLRSGKMVVKAVMFDGTKVLLRREQLSEPNLESLTGIARYLIESASLQDPATGEFGDDSASTEVEARKLLPAWIIDYADPTKAGGEEGEREAPSTGSFEDEDEDDEVHIPYIPVYYNFINRGETDAPQTGDFSDQAAQDEPEGQDFRDMVEQILLRSLLSVVLHS